MYAVSERDIDSNRTVRLPTADAVHDIVPLCKLIEFDNVNYYIPTVSLDPDPDSARFLRDRYKGPTPLQLDPGELLSINS